MILIVILLLLTSFLYYKWSKQLEICKDIPGPYAYPIIGNAHLLKGDMYNGIKNIMKKYGSICKLYIGPKLSVLITNPKDIGILMTNTKNLQKSTSYQLINPWLRKGLLLSDGNYWSRHRKLITPAFHFSILEKFMCTFNEKSDILIKKLMEQNENEFNVFPIIANYTFDALMETSMGIKMNSQEEIDNKYIKAVAQIVATYEYRALNIPMRLNCLFYRTERGKQFRSNIEYIDNYCHKVITNRQLLYKQNPHLFQTDLNDQDIGKKKRLSFLDLLLIGQTNENGMSYDEILEEVNTFIFAGFDTTANSISFILYALGKYENCQQKVYDEINDLFEDTSNLTLYDLQKTLYLDMFIKETMRLYTTVPFISRYLETDLKLENHTIPANTQVIMCLDIMHKDPQLFPNPDVFDPKRFSAENVKQLHPFAFVPFSAGPRNCVGQKYGLAEVKVTIIKILRSFKVHVKRNLGDLKASIILSPKNGYNICLERRAI